jgi:hypothetical protein
MSDPEAMLRRLAGQTHMERMGRMTGWALRGVLAMIDGEVDVLAAVLDCIADFDDQPGRPPLPDGYNRWQFAVKQVEALGDRWMAVADSVAGGISYERLMDGTRLTLNRLAPNDRRQTALDLLDRALDRDRAGSGGGEEHSAEMLLYYTALTAWVASQKRVFPARELVRLELLERIREAEHIAAGIPEAERIAQISDAEAFEFLAWMYDDTYVSIMPKDRAEWTVDVFDIIAAVKQHLLDTPVAETTAEQRRALNDRFTRILKTALAPYEHKPSPSGARPAAMRRPPAKNSGSGKRKKKR